MRRVRPRKTKPKKAKGPDEHFLAGPLQVARFGKNVVSRMNWSEGEFAAALSRNAELYPKVIQEIDSLVGRIAALVKTLPPERILHRAWWEMAGAQLSVKSEADATPNQMVQMRMIDYVQSVIAAVPPDPNPKSDVSEDDWQTLKTAVEALFNTLNVDYHICSTASRRLAYPNLDLALEEFRFKAQMYWCNVRGERYPNHQREALSDVLLPQSSIIEECFGISAQDLIENLSKISDSLTFGIANACKELVHLREAALNAMEADAARGVLEPDLDASDLFAGVIERHNLQPEKARVLGQLVGMDLFDLGKVTKLPERLLDTLSWAPGQDKEFFAEGELRGWPLRVWPTFKRPFIKIGGGYYCFDLFALFDHVYRAIEKTVFSVSEEKKQQWIKTRKDVSEWLPSKYFERLLPEGVTFGEVCYLWQPRGVEERRWYEADRLFLYDNHLFILEVKAGAFTYTSPATDFAGQIASLKNLVEHPAEQGKRFLDYLGSAPEVPIFDKSHREIRKLRKGAFRHITICAVTLDPFTELAAQVQHLRKIGVNIGDQPVWSVSVDDLRVCADIFRNPLEFLHFVEQRMRAFSSEALQLDDELDHVGLYLKHNNYSQHAAKMVAASRGPTKLQFIGYRSEIDAYFSDRLHDEKVPSPLVQKMPRRLRELIDYLAVSKLSGRSQLASYLLDIGGFWRNEIFNRIETVLGSMEDLKRTRPLSTHGHVRLTVFPWSTRWTARDEALALDHTRTVMLLNSEPDRLLLELTYSDTNELIAAHWRTVDLSSLSTQDLEMLRLSAERLRATRIERAKEGAHKLGRNVPCPCGSGRKYKHCCLR